MTSHGLAHPLSLPFLGCRVRVAPARDISALTPDERENVRAAMVLDMMDRAGVFDDGETALERGND